MYAILFNWDEPHNYKRQVCVVCLKAPRLDPIKSPKPECAYIDLKKAKMYLQVQTLIPINYRQKA